MQLPTILQGRPFDAEALAQVQSLLDRAAGQWSRYRLSRALAELWHWRTAHGQLKDMATRTLLLKLEQQGWIRLPPRRRPSPTRSGQPRVTEGPGLAPSPITGALASLTPLRWQEVSQAGPGGGRALLEACLDRYHYLGYRSRVGQNLQYWVCDRQQRPLAGVVFGAAAWQCAARDQWIGWSAHQRARHLGGVVNNTRFLLLPWVRVPHLASHILSGVSRLLRRDWAAKYRQPIWLLETFVERHRFAGTCYRAANWIHLGHTQGRGRQGPRPNLRSTTIKEVYVWPLHPDFRRHLTAAQHPDPSPPNPSCL
jgi:hypothetical protein